MKNKILIILMIIVIIALAILIVKFNRTENEGEDEIQEIETIKISDYTEVLKEILDETEQQYQEAVAISNIYNRDDFYNETRLSMNSEEAQTSVASLDEINIDEIYKVYNTDGELIEKLPETDFYEQVVEISDNTEIVIGNYYLIKYAPYSDEYSYYYISQLTNNGFQELDLYIIAKGDEIL